MVHEFLCAGSGNAVPGRELVNLLQLRNLRELTQAIEKERRGGFPICASTDSANPGYYLPETTEELSRYIGSLDRRLQNVAETRRSCKDALLRMTGQEQLGGF